MKATSPSSIQFSLSNLAASSASCPQPTSLIVLCVLVQSQTTTDDVGAARASQGRGADGSIRRPTRPASDGADPGRHGAWDADAGANPRPGLHDGANPGRLGARRHVPRFSPGAADDGPADDPATHDDAAAADDGGADGRRPGGPDDGDAPGRSTERAGDGPRLRDDQGQALRAGDRRIFVGDVRLHRRHRRAPVVWRGGRRELRGFAPRVFVLALVRAQDREGGRRDERSRASLLRVYRVGLHGREGRAGQGHQGGHWLRVLPALVLLRLL